MACRPLVASSDRSTWATPSSGMSHYRRPRCVRTSNSARHPDGVPDGCPRVFGRGALHREGKSSWHPLLQRRVGEGLFERHLDREVRIKPRLVHSLPPRLHAYGFCRLQHGPYRLDHRGRRRGGGEGLASLTRPTWVTARVFTRSHTIAPSYACIGDIGAPTQCRRQPRYVEVGFRQSRERLSEEFLNALSACHCIGQLRLVPLALRRDQRVFAISEAALQV